MDSGNNKILLFLVDQLDQVLHDIFELNITFFD